MRNLTGVLVAFAALVGASDVSAGSLSDLVPNLFGQSGILLAPPQPPAPSHTAHFTASSEQQLTVFNDSLRATLSTIPLPSPAGGLTFRFDPALGSFTRSSDDFGPIYSQRADTTGRGKITLGFSYTAFNPNNLDGKNLKDGDITVTFLHEPVGQESGCPPAAGPNCQFGFEKDTITGQIKATIHQDLFLLSATYGVLDNLDVSIALPIINTQIWLTGIATINHIGTGPGTPFPASTHTFTNGSDTLTVHSSDESWGPGDLVLRGKYNFLKTDIALLAAGLDLRLPSGSVDNLRGVGTPVVSPVFIASTAPLRTFSPLGGISPHVNVGFHLSCDTSKVDHEFYYNVGFDWALVKPLTFVFDVLGRQIINNNRIEAGQGPGGTQTSGSTIVDASIGFKVNLWKNIIGVANVLLPLNSTGLRSSATPMFGIEGTF
jgi:hypothetical protein